MAYVQKKHTVQFELIGENWHHLKMQHVYIPGCFKSRWKQKWSKMSAVSITLFPNELCLYL